MPKKLHINYIYLVLLTAIAVQLYLQWHYTLAWGDGFVQFEMAYHWLKGKGIQLCEVKASDLSQNVCSNQLLWPPGYPFLLKTCVPLFQDFIITGRFLDCVAIALLLILHFRILQITGFSRKTVFVIFLFFSVLQAPFAYLFSTDVWSMLAYEWSIWYALLLLKKKAHGWLPTLLLALSIFSMVFFKYMYYNLCIIPSCFLIIGFINADRKLRRQALALIVLLAVFTCLYFFFMASYTGNLTPLNRLETGLFWQHLLKVDALGTKSLFFTANIYKYLIIHQMTDHWIQTVLVIGEFMISFIIIWCIGYLVFWKQKILTGFSNDYLKNSYFLLVILTIVYSLGYLGALSVVYRWANGWTYVQETRYYIPAMMGIFTLFIYLGTQSGLPILYRFISRSILIVSLAFASIYGSYRIIAVSFLNHDNYNIYYLFDEIWEVNAQVSDLTQKVSEKPDLFAASDSRISQYAYFAGVPQIALAHIEKDGVHTSRPITLLLYVPEQDYRTEYAYILKNRSYRILKRVKKRGKIYLAVEIPPTP
ncbi:hypothetical protein BKI52_33845 [marine bacterium AO1-C]|nr:hypothetical protein BKI52_33845 [marine bacterium AO1-C]